MQGQRLRLALQSGLKTELAWALNVLALGSASTLEQRRHPDLLPLLLQVLVWKPGYRQVFWTVLH